MADFACLENKDTRKCKELYSIIEYISSPAGSEWNGFVQDCELVFILEGGIHITRGYACQASAGSLEGILLLPGDEYRIHFSKATAMIRFRLDGNFPLREYFRVDKAELSGISYPDELFSLRVNDKLHAFLCALQEECHGGSADALLSEIKRKELFHILHKYYGRREILSFLYPLFNENYSFISFVYNNYRRANSVPHFARLANCGLSTFCERFKASFGVSAYRWMMEKRNRVILNELTTTKKQVKQIATDTGFSASQFSDYCKKHFGMTPREIRENGIMDDSGYSGVEWIKNGRL